MRIRLPVCLQSRLGCKKRDDQKISNQKDKSKKSEPIQGAQNKPSGNRMFSDELLDEIHLVSLEILYRTGVRVYEAQSLTLPKEAG